VTALLPLGIAAFALGARHAFDVDHIAAIDNVTRKLAGEDRRPLWVGLFSDSALEMSEKLVETQYDFLTKVVRSAGEALGRRPIARTGSRCCRTARPPDRSDGPRSAVQAGTRGVP
jgi:hypothetical protein